MDIIINYNTCNRKMPAIVFQLMIFVNKAPFSAHISLACLITIPISINIWLFQSGPAKYHIKVSPQCSICVKRIFDEEIVTALFGKDHLYKGQIQPFALPALGSAYRQSNDYLFCRTKRCSCDSPVEYTTVHLECYQIFLRACDFGKIPKEHALQKLWIFTSWRLPWENALSMPASSVDIPTDAKSLQIVGQVFGINFLHRLPHELILTIWRESKDAMFWRCLTIIRLLNEIETMTSELQVAPLDQVLSWHRNGKLEFAPVSTMYPITRLTIDQEGIKEVERLPCRPDYTGDTHHDYTFIVKEGTSLHGIEAQFQDGRLRLRTTQFQFNYPNIWNTPAPPRFSLCKGLIPGNFTSRRLQVVNTQKVIGITFFFLQDRLYDIYIHDSDKSSANTLFEQLSPDMRKSAFWVYLPIGPTDKMLVFGTRFLAIGEYNVLIRMEKAGDVVIGRNPFFSANDYVRPSLLPEDLPSSHSVQCLGADSPVTLLYGESRQGSDIPVLAAYCESPNWNLPGPFMLEKPAPERFHRLGYYSRAPLDQIAEVTVYYKPDNGGCRGILMRYMNGGCRAVGQCRVNVDPSKRVAEPSLICVRKDLYTDVQDLAQEKTLVKFTHGNLHDKLDKTWVRYPLEGYIEFHFCFEHVLVEITTEFRDDVVRPLER
ncbi:hypothetical protein V8C42DRAFT_362542 [Trichoderma barbatum]